MSQMFFEKRLSNGVHARILDNGMYYGTSSNLVRIRLEIWFPTENDGDIIPTIGVFLSSADNEKDNPIRIIDEPIRRSWGKLFRADSGCYRWKDKNFDGVTYQQAIEKAIKIADEELSKIETAQKERDRALLEAGVFEKSSLPGWELVTLPDPDPVPETDLESDVETDES